MSEARWDLPESWTWAAAGDVARIVGGGTPSSKVENYFAESGIPWITPADLTGYRSSHISRGRRDLSKEGFASCGAQIIPAGSVLFSSRAPIGYCVIASNDVSTNQGFKSLVLQGDIVPEYIRYYLISAKDYAESKASGTTFMELSGARVAELSIPLAPIPEQKRIVAKVDGLTARTARARADLDRIPTLIARYKQRLLALAFSGELTAGWRQGRGLQTQTTTLPEGWSVRELGEISEIQGGIQVGKRRTETAKLVEVPYLRVANVQRGWLNLDEVKSISVTESERDRLRLESGDILMNEGGDRDKLGRGWVWEAQVPVCIHQNHVFRIRLNDKAFPPQYISHFANENGQKYFFDQGTQTTNLASISKRKVAALPVPLPPAEEAIEIVRLIASAFNWLDRMATDHAAASNLLPKLDAAILAKAFRGKLVPQDLNEEPASALLARIKAKHLETPRQVRVRRPDILPELPPTRVVGSTFPRPAKESAMTKSRQDDDVMGKPYLANLLKEGHSASAQDLFKAADLPVADFYKQLAWEIANKHIRDDDEKLEAL